jgi:hypothetical protein
VRSSEGPHSYLHAVACVGLDRLLKRQLPDGKVRTDRAFGAAIVG